jgi:hypothetical protein
MNDMVWFLIQPLPIKSLLKRILPLGVLDDRL